ncbi:MAG: hypothetical protein LR015_08200 [Verrucomicrobia bacterium]|nr:hypothetical protein [Verrucomicrobiota bacterium]
MQSKKLLLLSAALGFLSTSVLAADTVVQIHPLFDSGRIRTNTQLDGQGFNQWTNGTGTNRANNTGWNTNGVWYSFIRFAGTRAQGDVTYGKDLTDFHAAMAAAGSITLRGDVVWLERNPDFPVDPGVDVAVFLVPGLNIPEGSLPTFANTWPWNYPDAQLVTVIPTTEMVPLRASFNAAEANPVDTRDKMAYNLQIDLTAAVQGAISSGVLEAGEPWGIVLIPNDTVNSLNVPNNPTWVDLRGTVFQGSFWEVAISSEGGTPPPATWAGYPIFEDGWVYTGNFLGFIYPVGDFIYVDALANWMYLPEEIVEENGSWGYVFR